MFFCPRKPSAGRLHVAASVNPACGSFGEGRLRRSVGKGRLKSLFDALIGDVSSGKQRPSGSLLKIERRVQTEFAHNVFGFTSILFGGLEEVAEDGWEIWGNMREAFTPLAAYSFLTFNLLCAPCFAAIGAIKREMNSGKWTWFAIGYQCLFAYVVSLIIYQFGLLFTGNGNVPGTLAAVILTAGIVYMLARPYKESTRLTEKVKTKNAA